MSSAQCPQCGFVSSVVREVCAQCGSELSRSEPNPTFEENSLKGNARNATWRPKIDPHVGVGNVLSASISLFVKNIWPITKLVFWIFAPLEIFKTLTFTQNEQQLQVIMLVGFLDLVCRALIAPSLIYSLYVTIQTGVTPSLNESYRWGLSRLGTFSLSVAMAWVLQAVGTILCVVPGIIIGVGLMTVYPVATLEKRGPIEVLKRSWRMTDGYRGNIFVTALLISLLAGAFYIPPAIGGALMTQAGVHLWPIEAILALGVDIAGESMTVLSLVIYLSVVASVSDGQIVGVGNQS